ncbi:Hypothetical predicted protein [Olea europaea subsp. europaea]|uniref:Uncharacterized protein n=1 Tax=Olea europaea subsp. europaea TaxID=158383 RepID=A0A8S0Q2N3_OLEEU|nr:Hypothetical predicted protein [Olea europaea subsp. europaea]
MLSVSMDAPDMDGTTVQPKPEDVIISGGKISVGQNDTLSALSSELAGELDVLLKQRALLRVHSGTAKCVKYKSGSRILLVVSGAGYGRHRTKYRTGRCISVDNSLSCCFGDPPLSSYYLHNAPREQQLNFSFILVF